MTTIGAIALGMGLFVASSTVSVLTFVAIGAVLVFVGVNTLSPSFARPVATVLGRPFARLFGVSGQIAQGNAARSPRRTASTAGALMIGLALVGMAGVVGSSLTKTFLDTLDNSVEADYFIQSTSGGFDPSVTFSEEVADEMARRCRSSTRSRTASAWTRFRSTARTRMSSQPTSTMLRHLDADIVSGGLTDADAATSIAIHEDPATDLGLSVGDTVDVTFPVQDRRSRRAIYTTRRSGNYLIDNRLETINAGLGFANATVTGFDDNLPRPSRTDCSPSSGAIQPITDRSTVVENRVAEPAGSAQFVPRSDLRAAGAVARDRPDRHCQHAGAVGLRPPRSACSGRWV